MARINLAAGNGAERRILEYLEANASEALAEKINAGSRTIGDALKFCEGEARKLHSGSGCLCVDDATVFGWAVHFFEEREAEDGGRKAEDGERRTEGGGREAEDGDVESAEAGDNPFEGAAIFGGVK